MTRKILFLTGTRADFGKLKTLIKSVDSSELFEVAIFITGMHTLSRYGYTVDEVYRTIPEHRLQDGTRSVYVFHNQVAGDPMERILSSTIDGLSRYLTEFSPDLIVVHGDRVETLAGAITGAMRNILVAHIEGGEISGTIDELIRHAVTKMSHVHFVANKQAFDRLLQLGERLETVHVIGSPDIDLIMSSSLPDIHEVKRYYNIPYDNFGVVLYHPVTTDLLDTEHSAQEIADAIIESGRNHVVIYPNNDEGCELIFSAWKRLEGMKNIRILPSMRVEFFLALLKSAKYLLGNSSAGIHECPVIGTPTINVSTRQRGRSSSECILNVKGSKSELINAMNKCWYSPVKYSPDMQFGDGNSAKRFLEILSNDNFWKTSTQKQFNDI